MKFRSVVLGVAGAVSVTGALAPLVFMGCAMGGDFEDQTQDAREADARPITVPDAAPKPDAAPPPDAEPEADATPDAGCSAQSLLANGDFDSPTSGVMGPWQVDPSGNVVVFDASSLGVSPKSGENAASLGRANNVDLVVYQAVTVPEHPLSFTIRGYYQISTNELVLDEDDQASLIIYDSSGKVREVLKTWWEKDRTNTWKAFAVSPSSLYAGEEILIGIAVGTTSIYPTWFRFDSLEAEVMACPFTP